MGDRALAREEADALLAAQRPSADKRTRSTAVIDNDGPRDRLLARAREVWRALEARARELPAGPRGA